METDRFDTIVVGAGQSGPGLAFTLAGRGERVAVIERDKVGGTCLNRGCRPTKALRASAHVAQLARRAGEYGVRTGPVDVDFAAAIARKDAMIDRWLQRSTTGLEHADGIELVHGDAAFTGTGDDGHRLRVGDRTLTAPRVVLNTGTRSSVPDLPGLDAVPWLDNERVLHLDALPEHLLVLGGGYIALELGQVFRRFGSAVTILQRGPRVAAREDEAISAEIARFLTEEGVEIRTSADVRAVSTDADRIILDTADGPVTGSHLLVATGRTPNTDTLGLDTIGLTTDERGNLATDDVFRTGVEGIYAVGDINGRGAFTHTSYQDYEILADHLAGGERTAAGRITTYAVFTDPPLGRVGLTEAEARATGRPIRVAHYEMADVTRAVLDGDTAGLVTVVVDAETDRFLGAAVLGESGDEVVQVVSALMHADAPYQVLERMLPIHPTVAEFYPTWLGALSDVS